MKRFVLDASVALAWCFEDQTDEYAESVLEQLGQHQAVVPALWIQEVANVLTLAQRKKKLTAKQLDEHLAFLCDLPIQVEATSLAATVRQVVPLARQHGLTVYDACYLELAARLALPIATLDSKLASVSTRAGIAAFAL